MNGGTTGGAGGRTVTVSTGAQLIAEVDGVTPVTIYVNGTITLANTAPDNVLYVKNVSNVTIIGQNADFNGVGFKVKDSSNIILQNLKIHHTENSENGDGVEIDGSNNVWVDHCEFYNISPLIEPDKDRFDGLVDVKNASQYVTISWNYFHDHWKGCLAGHSDTQTGDTAITVTYHHNYFKNLNSRAPLLRFGKAHMYNNYLVDIRETGSNSRNGAIVRVDNQVYENAGSGSIDPDTGYAYGPIGYFYTDYGTGYWVVNGVQYINCLGSQPTTSTASFTPPYSYSLDATANVKSIVMAGAGLQ
jgi:pectate lyase